MTWQAEAPNTTQNAAAFAALGSALGVTAAVNHDRLKIIGRHGIGMNPQNGTSVDYSATGRPIYAVKGQITRVAALFGQLNPSAGSELALGTTATIIRASAETANSVIPLTKNGQRDFAVTTALQGFGAWTDIVGAPVAAGGSLFIRNFQRVATPPISPAAAAITGGFLAASTTFYYKLTTVDNGVESSPTAEVSAATGASGTLAIQLTWTAPTNGSYINIYKGTSTGSEKFLAQVPIQQTSFADIGVLAANTNVAPPAANQLWLQRTAFSGESGNTQDAGGAGTDVTGSTGAITGVTGPSGGFIPTPLVVVGDDYANPALILLGDSIVAPAAVYRYQIGQYAPPRSNYFDAAFSDGQFAGSLNAAISSTLLSSLLNGTNKGPFRLSMIAYADYCLNELGTNDIVNGRTWQQLATDHLTLARIKVAQGGRYIAFTLLPRTTGSWHVAGAQTVLATEAQRVNYNTWLRNGCLVDGTGAPVLTGGTPSTLIYAVFDGAAAIEVNASNVLTQNGGFILAPSAAAYTGQILTGTPTLTSLTAAASSFPVPSSASPGVSTYLVLMTSGAAYGQTAIVTTNTATGLTLYANGSTSLTGVALTGLTTTPAAGDTFSLYQLNAVDGVHYTIAGSAVLAASLAPWMVTNIVKFGPMLAA